MARDEGIAMTVRPTHAAPKDIAKKRVSRQFQQQSNELAKGIPLLLTNCELSQLVCSETKVQACHIVYGEEAQNS